MREWNEHNPRPDRAELQAASHMEFEQLRSADPGARLDALRSFIAANTNPTQAAETLAEMLHDASYAVRATAAHRLIDLRETAVRPVLQSLARDVQSALLRSAVHRVLLALYESGCLNPQETLVLHALESPDPASRAALALPAALYPVTSGK